LLTDIITLLQKVTLNRCIWTQCIEGHNWFRVSNSLFNLQHLDSIWEIHQRWKVFIYSSFKLSTQNQIVHTRLSSCIGLPSFSCISSIPQID